MNKENYNQIVVNAYKNYMNKWPEKLPRIGPCTQEEFINKIKTDDEFSKTWDLKIEERELSLKERIEILRKREDSVWLNTGLIQSVIEPMLEEHNIPTKLITITYNNETIESYV